MATTLIMVRQPRVFFPSCLWVVVTACGSSLPPSSADSDGLDAASPARGAHTVTLLTGDRVTVDQDAGAAVHITPAPGRAHVGFLTQRVKGETLVIPRDIADLVVSGCLDTHLFNVTELLADGYDDAHRADVPVIVTGAPDVAGLRRRFAASGVAVERLLPALHAVALRQRKDAPASILAQLDPSTQRVWLDRRFQPTLDRSVPQVGAPAAYARGLTGAGVVVAVLDSGVDSAHPDLADKVQDAETFIDDGLGTSDVVGHGTHVASIIAGSGAASSGQFHGVAPDAALISGRVCDATGCPFSAILAGMEWAAATKGARVINMSLGGVDGAGVDPIEDAVNRLSADFGALFVVSAGNFGPFALSSPATADAALAVGAVDRDEQLAEFSSRGPRSGDFAVKPEITAPGVGIVAARASAAAPDFGEPVGTSYLRLSGTSMAAPHVAGAAAILLQQHPDWTSAQLKAA
ncbi:MAG: S8 family serine peptidase, partial [bacterium]